MEVKIESTLKPKICLLGGTGFVGKHLAAHLCEGGFTLRIPTRRAVRHRDLQVLPRVELVQANVHDSGVLTQLLSGCDVVINLIAILNERRRGDFENVHVRLVQHLIEACRETSVTRVLHMSALHAGDVRAKSIYHRTKGEGENLMHAAADLSVTSFRPAVIFGPDDHFFNRFAGLLKTSPGLMPLACPDAKMAPVYVGDIAHAMHVALRNPDTIGRRYELCGPNTYTLHQLVQYTADTLNLKRHIIGLGNGLSSLQARVMGLLPGKPFSYDNYLALRSDAVCTSGFPPIFEREPTALESIVPIYLGRDNQRARLDEARKLARHTPN
ncbi:MAG: complex I NDUFA9 subunit family protein [Chromatiales bacterium]|jgi:NADH dehydrogenase|nr:complex I NDUFA9 subunit family protein [Chromatiales bacterium]